MQSLPDNMHLLSFASLFEIEFFSENIFPVSGEYRYQGNTDRSIDVMSVNLKCSHLAKLMLLGDKRRDGVFGRHCSITNASFNASNITPVSTG